MASCIHRSLLLGAASAFVFSTLPSAAFAQTSEAQASGEDNTIIVTARRRAENLQDTPVSVTVVSGEALEDHQVSSSNQLDQLAPNLQFHNNAPLAGNNASSQIFIRGIGQTDPTSTVDPGVGIYIDDVYQSGGVGGTFDFRDVANIQVLRGPQGSLFGRNTIGGAIVLTTVDPGDEFGGSIRVKTGTDNLLDAFGAVDIPLGQGVRSRFTFGRRVQDGYVKRPDGEDLGDANTYTATGKIIFDLSDRFNVRLLGDYTKADENGSPLVFAAINPAATFVRVASFDAGCPGMGAAWNSTPSVPLVDDPRCGNNYQNAGPFRNNGTFPLESTYEHWATAVVANYDFGNDWSFKSISSYRGALWTGKRDADNTPLTILHTSYDSKNWDWSQEFQLNYSGQSLHGVAGAYYFKGRSNDVVTVELNTPAPGIQHDSDNNVALAKNWAFFTEWTWDVTQQLSLTLGGRYTEDTKGSIPRQFDYASVAATDDTPGVLVDSRVNETATNGTVVLVEQNGVGEYYLPPILYERTDDSFTPSATASYRWSPEVMTYVRYAEGFKGGGWNSHFNTRQNADAILAFQSFGPEHAKSTEIGAKLDLLDRKLRLNGAVFTTDYTDLQFTYRVGVAPYLATAGKASIDGFEAEWNWLLGGGWEFDGGIGHLDSSIDELVPIAGTAIGVKVGNKLPFAPDWQGNAGLSFEANMPGGWSIRPRVDMFYQGKTFFDAGNTVEIAQNSSVTLWNASLKVDAPDDSWSLVGGVNDIGDEVYPIAGNSSLGTSSGYAEIAYNRGRTWFIGVNKNF